MAKLGFAVAVMKHGDGWRTGAWMDARAKARHKVGRAILGSGDPHSLDVTESIRIRNRLGNARRDVEADVRWDKFKDAESAGPGQTGQADQSTSTAAALPPT